VNSRACLLTLPARCVYVVVVSNIMDGYISVNEAARRLGRSIEQVRRYLREGRLPGRRIGGQWFIEEDALAAWRPERRGVGQVSEAVATYEAKPMETKKTKKGEPLTLEEWLAEAERLRETIWREHGELDVVEMVRRDREEH
jgi:excisionase family DNA binding protein